MNRRYIVAAALLCMAGCAAPGPNTETPTSVAKGGSSSAEATNPEAERICSYERKTGSTIRTKVCRTPAEMEALKEGSRDVLSEMDKSSTAATGQ